jgi:hypothetical protein
MKCQYLKTYNAASGTWSVNTCSARLSPYVPSLSEVTSYCATSRSQSCIHGRRVTLNQGTAAPCLSESAVA